MINLNYVPKSRNLYLCIQLVNRRSKLKLFGLHFSSYGTVSGIKTQLGRSYPYCFLKLAQKLAGC